MSRSVDLGSLSVGARSAVEAWLRGDEREYASITAALTAPGAVSAAQAVAAIRAGAAVRGRGEERTAARWSGPRLTRL